MKDALDDVFGSGWYEDWRALERQRDNELSRAKVNQERFRAVTDQDVSQLSWDVRDLQEIGDDLREQIERLVRGADVDIDRIEELHAMLSASVLIVEADNDILDSAAVMFLLAGFLGLFKDLTPRARELEKILAELVKLLEKAKKESDEAWYQLGINTLLTAVTVLMPHVGLLTRGAAMFAQLIVDDALGPDKSGAKSAASDATTIGGSVLDAASKYKGLSETKRSVASKAGKTLTFAGFAFDADEILTGYANVKEIEAKVASARVEHAKLMSLINRIMPGLAKFAVQYRQWRARIADTRKVSEALRSDIRVSTRKISP